MRKRYLVVSMVFLLVISSIGPLSFGYKLPEKESLVDNYCMPQPLDGITDSAWPMSGNDAQNTCLSTYSTDQNDGYEKWKCFIEDPLDFITPVIDNEGTLYVSSKFHDLYAINPNGTIKWHSNLIGSVHYQPVIGLNGTIYVGTMERFHAFYPNGTLQWILPMKKEFRGDPVISPEGIIYVGTKDGYLYAVNPNGTIQWEYYLGYSIVGASLDNEENIYFGAQHCDYLYCLYPNGTLRWTFETIQEISDAPLIGDDGTIYTVPIDYIIAINPDGTEKWRVPSNGDGRSPALAPDGTIIYSSYEKGDVVGLNPENGQIKWCYQTGYTYPEDKTRPAISSDGTIFFAYRDGEMAFLSALNPDGNLKWTNMISSDIHPVDAIEFGHGPSIDANGTVYITTWFIAGEEHDFFGYVHAFGQLDPNAPSAPTINGQVQGKTSVQYEYTFTSTSPTGDDLYYFVLWGDETYSDWTGPFSSGEQINISHTWSEQGKYSIRARARDLNNLSGLWGTKEVTMPRNRASFYGSLFLRFLEQLLLLQRLLQI